MTYVGWDGREYEDAEMENMLRERPRRNTNRTIESLQRDARELERLARELERLARELERLARVLGDEELPRGLKRSVRQRSARHHYSGASSSFRVRRSPFVSQRFASV